MGRKWKANGRKIKGENWKRKGRKGLRNEEPGEGGGRGERRRAGGRSSRAGPRAGNGDTDATRCRADARMGARGLSPAGMLADTDSGVELVGSKRLPGEIKAGEDGGWRG